MKMLIVLLLFSFQTALADDCQPVRLDVPGGAMAQVRAQTQGELGICAFNVMSQMFDSARHVNGDLDKHITSPLALAVQRYSLPTQATDQYSNRPDSLDFFFEASTSFCWDFEALKRNAVGSCNEVDYIKGLTVAVPDGDWWNKASDFSGLYDGLEKIDRYTADIENCDKAPELRVGDNIFYLARSMKKALARLGGDDKFKKTTASICSPEKNKSFDGYSCESELSNVGIEFLEKQDYAVNTLHQNLSKGQPQSLTLCHEVLVDKRAKGFTYNQVNNELKNCTGHAVIAMGRRKSKRGVCQVLLRNSQDIKCRDYAEPKNCDSPDSYWIDAEKLKGNILDIALISKD